MAYPEVTYSKFVNREQRTVNEAVHILLPTTEEILFHENILNAWREQETLGIRKVTVFPVRTWRRFARMEILQ